MPTLTQPYENYEKPGIVLAYELGTEAIFKGALVGLTIDGKPAPISPSAPMRFLGVAGESVDPAKGAKRVNVTKLGSFVFGCAAGFVPTNVDIGRPVVATSDWQVRISSEGLAHPVVVGTIVSLETTSAGGPGVRVRIDLYTV